MLCSRALVNAVEGVCVRHREWRGVGLGWVLYVNGRCLEKTVKVAFNFAPYFSFTSSWGG